MEQKVRFTRVLRLAGAFVACAIGSGFATGQEIMQFFTAQGLMSLAGSVLTGVLFAWCGSCLMRQGYLKKLSDPGKVLKFYFGRKGGPIAAILVQVFLYSVYVIMVAGAGATFHEFFGLPAMVGRVLIAVLCFVTILFGLNKTADLLGSIGTVIIVFSLTIGLLSFLRNPEGLEAVPELVGKLDMTRTSGGWLWSSVLYPAYNAIVVLFLSCCLGEQAENEKEAALGGALGGGLFGLAILTMNLGLLTNLKDIFDKSVPTLALADKIHPVFAVVFAVIICCGIFSTAFPMLWGVVRHFAEDRTKKSVWIAFALTLLGLVLGMTDFKKLVNIIYPFSGYVGLLLMVLVAVQEVRILRERKRTE